MMKIKLSIVIISFLFGLMFIACSSGDGENPPDKCTESTWYQDNDNDGLGNPNVSRMACDKPAGYVANSNDNDDLNIDNFSLPTSGYTTPDTYTGMTLRWADEFDDSQLDETKWNFQLGDGCPNLCGWGNNELEVYKKENTSLQSGNLVIEIKKDAANAYSSSRINTQGKFSFKYGRVDIRAALPVGQGLWPAIWMLGENIDQVGWPKCGEIDIVEKIGGVGRENTIHGTVHWDNFGQNANYGGDLVVATDLNQQYHVYSIVWTPESIIWYLDDVQFHIIDITPDGLSEFQEEFHLLINCAVGGNWPGSPDASTSFAQYLIVDYIRVFQ